MRNLGFLGLATGLLLLVGTGCSSTGDEYDRDVSSDIGQNYGQPPAGYSAQMAACLDFEDQTETENDMGSAAADQMTTLLVRSNRFRMVERQRLRDLLQEQNLEGIVDPSTAAEAGQVLGTKYLIMGSVTDFEVKQTETGSSFGIFGIGYESDNEALDVRVGVDVRVVDSTTGEIVAAENGVFDRTASASGLGVRVLDISASTQADVQFDESNQGKLLRYALDDALQDMLPLIDNRCGSPDEGDGASASTGA